MRDRWDEEDELDQGRGRAGARRGEPEPEPTLGETIDGAVRKLVTGLVIAGALIGLGVYGSGGSSDGRGSDLEYQIATSADGQIVYRINTDSGSIVACRLASNSCWLMQRGNRDLDDEPPAENVAAPPSAQPQAVTGQPAPAQLPAPQNVQAPARR